MENILLNPVMLLPCILLAVVAVIALTRRGYNRSVLKQKELLTGNELEFYFRLKRALPRHNVCPQVSMGALLNVALPSSHPSFWALRRQFAFKIIDYVVCEPKRMRVIAVVELDDRTHDSSRDRERDGLLAAVGIRTFRFQSMQKPSVEQIQAAIGVSTGIAEAVAA